jgi:hypothetical protein
MKFFERENGFAHILVFFLIMAIVTSVLFLARTSRPNFSLIQTATSTPLPIALPSSSPSSSPLPVPTLTPTPTSFSTKSPSPATPIPVSGPPGAGFSYITVKTEKGNFTASVLSIDLNSSRMITDTANDSDCVNDCPVTNVATFVSKNGGYAGVNGTYLCPDTYPDCSSKKNSFDFPVWNTRLGHWINGGNLGWNSRSIFYTDGSGAHYNQKASNFSGTLTAGVVNYPGLLDNGNIQIDDSQSGLSDKQRGVNSKTGIGLIDSKHILVVVANNVNMQQFAYVFKALGAKSALNLDNGGSSALYYNGRYLLGPGRNVPNAIIFAK